MSAGDLALLATDRVSRRFGGFEAVVDVTISVSAGEVVGLLGANGAGKTTLLRMALGLLAPTSGSVSLLGRAPDRGVRQRIGYVPQGLGLWADMSASENLQFIASVYGRPDARLPAELAGRGEELVGRLPLGSQRELAFACAMVHDPVLVVLDEPTSGVGAQTRAELWARIRDRAEAGVGVLVTTHYMAEAQQCDRLLLMSGGRLVAAGSEADIIGGTTAVQVTTSDWAAAFAALTAAGLPVTLAGTDVRVADRGAQEVAAALSAAGLRGEVAAVPATIEERMTVLSQAGASDRET